MKSNSRDILIKLVKEHGEALYGDARRCRSFLSDLLGDRLHINILSTAVGSGVVEGLLSSSTPNLPFVVVSRRLSKRLCDDHGIAEDLALWAVETWAYALGIQSIDDLTTPTAPQTLVQGSTAKPEPSTQQKLDSPPKPSPTPSQQPKPAIKQKPATNSSKSAADSHLTLGWAHYDARRYSDATRSFKRAIDLDPGSADAHRGLAWCRYFANQYDEAERLIKRARTLDPSENYSLEPAKQLRARWERRVVALVLVAALAAIILIIKMTSY